MYKVIVATAVFLLAQLGSLLGGEPPFLATVTGTVVKQEFITPSDSRLRTSTLNNKRIFAEYQVSPDDYALVVDTSVRLILQPKSASSGKAAITVFQLEDISTFLNTKAYAGRFVSGGVSSTATDNLFKGLSGAVQGSFKFNSANNMFNVTKLGFSFVGRGTDISKADSNALLQFKVVSGKSFTQAP